MRLANKTMTPTFTIITPLYNAERYFRETFDSVIKQTFTDFEWIVVDDCSTDGSLELARSLAESEPRMTVITLEKNGGSAKARNAALDVAKGHYVTFLDADDLLDPNYLESQLEFIKDNGPIISAGYRRMAEETTTEFHVPENTTYKSILTGNPLSCLSTVYDRTVFPDERLPEDMQRHEDFVFWVRLLKKGYVAKGNPEILATYRILKHSKNSSKAKLLKPMVVAYHKKLGLSLLRSWFYTFKYVLYSRKKYKGVH